MRAGEAIGRFGGELRDFTGSAQDPHKCADIRDVAAKRATKLVLTVQAAYLAVGQLVLLTTGIPDGAVDFMLGALMLSNLVAVAMLIGYALTMQGRKRVSWLLLGAAAASWCFASLYLNTVLIPAGDVPVPSLADLFFLAFFPLALGGLLLQLPPRLKERTLSQRIDGVAAALAVAALSAAIVLDTVVSHATSERMLEFLTITALPIGDALLLGAIVASFALNHWRANRSATLVGVGLVAFWLADSGYVLLQATQSYNPPEFFDTGWPLCILLFAVAARHAALAGERSASESSAPRAYADVISPIVFAAISLATLATAAIVHLHPAAIVLATLSLALMLLRLGLSLASNEQLLERSQTEAHTDALTGLGNRRALLRDLSAAIDAELPTTLVLFDLDGFKAYNDVFGHPAGDALLQRLANALAARITDERGGAYRIGGDEFCALVEGHSASEQLAHLVEALSESGEGFQIGASFGAVHLPPEAGTAEDALRIVDQRMYDRKHSNRSSARAQSTEVLVHALYERVPQMQRHLEAVRERATQTALFLGIELTLIERLRHAAMLHDIGCMSIPDAILTKPGPLTDEEAEFVREHPAAGARILEAAPALRHLAEIVRSVHERFDGSGYPDGLSGEQIPIEARIIAICDAYDTMIAGRPFREPMSSAEALMELRAQSGTQFDPALVDAFAGALETRAPQSRAV